MITHRLLIDAIHVWKNIFQPFDTLRNLDLSYISLSVITKGHTYYKLGNTFSLTKWMGLNSFWSFSWRYSLVYWLIVKILSSRFDLSPSVEITASTWSKPHYCVPNFFFPVLSRETNPSKRKYIKDELVLFPALPRNLNFVSFDVFKSQHFSTTSKKRAQEIICSLTWRKKRDFSW